MALVFINGGATIPGGRIRFGNLEFVASIGGRLWLNPILVPTQACHFGSLVFVADGSNDRRHHDRTLFWPLVAHQYPAFKGEVLTHIGNGTPERLTGTSFPGNSVFVGMVEYAASFYDLLEGPSFRSSGSKIEHPEGEGESREFLMVDIINAADGGDADATPAGASRGNNQAPPQLTLAQQEAY
jgi:hypothetical protein